MKKSFNLYILLVAAILLLGFSIYRYYQNIEQKETAKSEQKISSLREAISLNNQDAVKFLIKSGADIEKPFTVDKVVSVKAGDKGFTALGWALYTNRPEIATYLLENGADVKASVPVEASMLYWAIAHEMSDVALLLIAKGAQVNTLEGYNPAQHANILGLDQVVEKLKEKGITPKGEDAEYIE